MDTIGDRIIYLRECLEMKQVELARKFRRLSCDSKARLEERLEALLEAQEREM